jgi:penicillin-binding protein 1A
MTSRARRQRRRLRNSGWKKKIAAGLSVLLIAVTVAGGVGASWAIDIYNSAPPLASLKPVQKGRSSAIYAADGSLIGFIRASSIRQPVPRGRCRRTSSTPRSRSRTATSSSTARSTRADRRAAWKNLLAGGKPVQGASTITQQLVRNLYIRDPEPTIERKLIEAHLAYEQEEAHSKQWILTEYLNTSPYGTVEGQTAVGAEAAAQTYFAKPAKDLNLTEAALIAGLPQAPSEYNPFLDPQAATQRRNDVLEAMEEEDYITSSEYREAIDSELGLHPGHKYKVIRDPFLFDLVQQELIDKYGINTVRNGGLKAYTTIDPELQERAQEAVESCYVCYPEGGPAAGLASVTPRRRDRRPRLDRRLRPRKQFNYAWQAHRSPAPRSRPSSSRPAIKQGSTQTATMVYDGTSPMTLEIPPGAGPRGRSTTPRPAAASMSLDDRHRALGQRRLRPARPRRRGPRTLTRDRAPGDGASKLRS